MRSVEFPARGTSLVEASSGVTRVSGELSAPMRMKFGKYCRFATCGDFLIHFSFNQKVVVVDTND